MCDIPKNNFLKDCFCNVKEMSFLSEDYQNYLAIFHPYYLSTVQIKDEKTAQPVLRDSRKWREQDKY